MGKEVKLDAGCSRIRGTITEGRGGNDGMGGGEGKRLVG